MRRMTGFAVAALGAAFLCGSALGENVRQAPYSYQPLGYCQITSLATAKAMATASCTTGSVPTQVNNAIAEICVSGAAIRYRDDGTAPTASLGIPVAAGNCFQYSGNIPALQIIQQSASATIDATFYN